MKRILLLCLVLTFGFSQTAVAGKVIKPSGGLSFATKIGPWYIFKANYSDKARTCDAVNFTRRQDYPAFMVGTNRGPKGSFIYMRFEAKKNPKGDQTADLVIGDKRFKLAHPGEYAHGGFFPTSEQQMDAIADALLERGVASKKTFFVQDAGKKQYKFDARQTAKMMDYLAENCSP